VEDIMKLEPARRKRLRGPAVMLFVIGNLKEHNPIPFTVPQILSLYKTDLPILRADSAHYVTTNFQRVLVHNCKVRVLNYTHVALKRVVMRFHGDLISLLERRGPIFPDGCDKKG
jgi:hypothetical protein